MRRTALLSALVVAVSLAAAGAGSPSGIPSFDTVDGDLCPFPLDVSITGPLKNDEPATTALALAFTGRTTILIRNEKTGRSVTLTSSGPTTVSRSNTVTFSGHHVWFWLAAPRIPYLATDGSGTFRAPRFLLSGSAKAKVLDPCALVAPARPSTKPRATRAPWGLPAYPLTQMAYAGFTPLLGNLLRHDHVHLDLRVDGRKVTVPAGVGLVQPVDRGPCPPSPGNLPQGDCTTKNVYTAAVANSPVHTHSSSGIIHIETDRKGTVTLGAFFDEWGVRLTSSCVGGYCTGGGKQLRAYVNGRRVTGSPRKIVLTNRQEVALVYGRASAFRSVPAKYAGGWPGLGCGGPGEFSC
ncbi:MAG TPA: hypothetical protein VGL76_05610 [Gaiellaceae bacterium]